MWITLGGWPSGFYIFGASGIIWLIAWVGIVTESPEYESLPEEKETVMSASNGKRDGEVMKSLEESQKDEKDTNGIIL